MQGKRALQESLISRKRDLLLTHLHVPQLSEGPHVIDPREAHSAGFYPENKGAVVICDFQSLYPSVCFLSVCLSVGRSVGQSV